jgi:signal transduction histidine kinase
VAMLDNEGKYIVANQIYEDKFQKKMGEIEGHHYSEVLTEEILQKHRDLISQGLKGERTEFDEMNIYPNGTKQHSFGEYIPIFNKEGDFIFLLVYVTNISSLKAIEQELTEINQSKNKLFSIIAHDLRSPLNTLTGLLELVDNNLVNEQEFKSVVGELSKNVSYTSQLLNNLLHWASNQMERQVVHPQQFDIHSLIEDNIALASKNALQKQITLSYNKANDYQIWADKDMIDLVLRNLISNAIKFTPVCGNIHITATAQANYVSVSVQDNGIGMSSQAVDKLFQYQMHSTRGTNGEKGSGLGLILCKEFVEKNGGQIEVISKLNEGTTFTFTVPCTEAIAKSNSPLQL